MNKASWLNITWLLALSLYLLIKEVIAPMVKKIINKNQKTENPINIQRFYQEFVDFKAYQEGWNKNTDSKLEKLLDILLNRK